MRPDLRTKHPFATMEVGQFFFAPGREMKKFSPHISVMSKKLGRRFTARTCWMREQIGSWVPTEKDDPQAVQGVSVWRVE